MINKIIIMVASSLTIAGISYGIYTARKVATTTPICYRDMEQGYSGVNYGDTIFYYSLALELEPL